MCTLQALKKGLNDIAVHKGVVFILWLTDLLLALAVALPVFGWLGRMNRTVAAQSMLNGFSLPLLFDLGRYDFAGVVRIFGALACWLVFCALVAGTMVSGGVLAVLAAPGRQPLFEHFLRGAGRYFGRFFRLLIGACLAAGLVLVAINLALAVVIERVFGGGSELSPAVVLGQVAVNLVIGTAFLLALHYARIETVVEGRSRMARAYVRSLVFVYRNILKVFAVIVVFAALTGAVYLVYAVVRSAMPTTTWLFILSLTAIQQTVMLARSAFRVGLYGAELELFLLRRPKPPEPLSTLPPAP
ncbi:MAG: hypothetical protein ACE15E_13605 [Acidobacteriota bacterium]